MCAPLSLWRGFLEPLAFKSLVHVSQLEQAYAPLKKNIHGHYGAWAQP